MSEKASFFGIDVVKAGIEDDMLVIFGGISGRIIDKEVVQEGKELYLKRTLEIDVTESLKNCLKVKFKEENADA